MPSRENYSEIQSLWNPFRDWNLCLWRWQPTRNTEIQSLWNPFRDWNGILRPVPLAHPLIQSLWNPFRDWNWLLLNFNLADIKIQSLWNPFRDWNFELQETGVKVWQIQSLWNPFRDWNPADKYPTMNRDHSRFKASETLLGIETLRLLDLVPSEHRGIQSLWNPFRDWNKHEPTIGDRVRALEDSKPLKPF